MSRFDELNDYEKDLVRKTGFIIVEGKEYTEEDYEKCANGICNHIMSHSKNEIPKVQKEFSSTLRKII